MAKFFIETYGCQMNIAETDSLKTLLNLYGHEEAETPLQADVAILNTCSVRLTAEERIVGRIGFYRGLNQKRDKKIGVVLMGCMAQNMGQEIRRQFPDVVKLVWGSYHKEGIIPLLDQLERAQNHLDLQDFRFLSAEPQQKYPFKAFVPISHGCDNFCSYCIVPHVRGREIHRSSEDILDNIRRLVEQGVVEICLLGQNVNSYRQEDTDFPALLAAVAEIEGVKRLTYLTSHPKDFSPRLVEIMLSYPVIMPFFHLPFQAGNDRILQLMNRKYTREQYLEKIALARRIPGLVLTTDIMVGFPTETDDEFEDTMNIVEQVRFNEAFMYRYNIRPGTSAENIQPQVPEEIKLSRLNRLIETQNRITRESLPAHIGNTYSVLTESVSKKDSSRLTGRAHNGLMVFFRGESSRIGKIVNVNITGIAGVGLEGEIITG